MSLRKNETLAGWTLLDIFCLHFWAWLLNTIAITPKSEDKICPKVFTPPEFQFSEVTFFQNWYFKALYSFIFGLNTLELLNFICSGLITTLPIPIMISERTVVVLVTRCFYKHSGYIYDFFHINDCNDLDYTLLNWFDISDFSVKVFIASRVSSK